MKKNTFVGTLFFIDSGVRITSTWCMGGYGEVLDKVGNDNYLVEFRGEGPDFGKRSVMPSDVFVRAVLFSNDHEAKQHSDKRRKAA
jgi:hypothetical protein